MLENNRALLGERLYSLSADTLIVLYRVGVGMTDSQIIEWSQAWNFTQRTIDKAFMEASAVFEIGEDVDTEARREVVLAMFARCREAGLTAAPHVEQAKGFSVKQKVRPASERMTMSGRKGGQRPEVALYSDFDLNGSVEFKSVLNANIRSFAKATNTQLGTLTSAINKSVSYFCGLKKCTASVNLDKITRFSQVLGIPVDVLVSRRVLKDTEITQVLQSAGAGSKNYKL